MCGFVITVWSRVAVGFCGCILNENLVQRAKLDVGQKVPEEPHRPCME